MPEKRVCVPNEELGQKGNWQERGSRTGAIINHVIPEAREKCERALGETGICALRYTDITALASELKEVGYVKCPEDWLACQAIVAETASDVEVRLRDPAQPAQLLDN